jgi:hypothetical protein
MSFVFNGPIPGQSLTSEPRSLPFERPADIVDPIEALEMHIDKMSEPEAIEDALFFLEMGLDLVTLVEGILRSAVMEGIHSLDVSMIIAPVLHEHIKSIADAADIDYDEGFDDPDRDKALEYQRDTMRAEKLLKRLSKEEGIEEEEPKEIPEEEEPMEETSDMAPPTQGLMSRVAQ